MMMIARGEHAETGEEIQEDELRMRGEKTEEKMPEKMEEE